MKLTQRQLRQIISETAMSLMTITDTDNGKRYHFKVEKRFGGDVYIRFGDSFGITIDRGTWDDLAGEVEAVLNNVDDTDTRGAQDRRSLGLYYPENE